MLYSLSPSKLNLLEDCPRCFWLQMIKKQSRPSGGFPTLPSGVDKKIKEHFDRFRSNNSLPPELKKANVKAELFKDMELLNVWRNNRKGIQYNNGNGIVLRGAVDEILKYNDKLIVLDFKTKGYEIKEDSAHVYQDQLDIYNFLLRKNNYETEDYGYILFYVPDTINENGEFIFKTDLIKMNIDVGHAEELFNKAINVLNNDMPDSNIDCGYCKFRENIDIN